MFLTRQYHRNNEISGNILDAELPYSYIVDNVLLNKDLSMSIGWSLELPLVLTMDVAARASLQTSLRAMLNSMDPNFDFQMLWTPQHYVDPVVMKLEANLPKSSMLSAYQREQTDLIRQRGAAGYLRKYRAYFFLTRKNNLPPGEKMRREKERRTRGKPKSKQLIGKASDLMSSLFSLFSSPKDPFYYAQEFLDARADLFGQGEGVFNAFRQMNVEPTILTENEMLDILYYWWNPMSWESGLRPRSYEPGRHVPVTDYVIQSPFIWDPKKGYFELDGALHRILTVRVPPEMIDMPQFEGILYDSSFRNMTVCCTAQRGDVEKRIAKLTNELPLLRSRAGSDPRLWPTLEQLQAEIIALAEQNEAVWHATHVIHLWSKDHEELDEWTREIKRKGLQANGMQIVQEEHALFEYARSSTPGWTRDKDVYRQHIYNSTQLTGMMPLCGQPDRFDSPMFGAVMETATGGLFNFVLHDQKNLNNYNCIIIGTSGTGKSFLASTIMAQLQRANARIIGIDLGGSYRGICAALQGNYVTMDIDLPNQRINPLYFPPNQTVESSDIERMLLFIEKLVLDTSSGQQRLSKAVMGDLEEAMRQLIQSAEGREIFLSNYQSLVSKSFNKEVGRMLQPWVGRGMYAKLFDGASQIDFDNPFTMFDLSLVKDNRDIAPLALMSIMNGINAMANKYPRQPKLLLIDEAWFMLQDPIIRKFVAECFRTFRKTGTGIIGISQGIEEWVNLGEEKAAILNNTHTYIILKQSTGAAVMSAASELGLNPQEAGLLGALITVPGEFSQGLLHQQRADGMIDSVVVVNRPTPLLYAMSTTNPKDKDMMLNYRESGMSMVESIVKFSQEYPRGTMLA